MVEDCFKASNYWKICSASSWEISLSPLWPMSLMFELKTDELISLLESSSVITTVARDFRIGFFWTIPIFDTNACLTSSFL